MLRLIERLDIEKAFGPLDITGAGADGDWCKLVGQRGLVVLTSGAWAGGTSAITLEQATDNAGAGAKALGFTRMWKRTSSAAPGSAGALFAEVAVAGDTFDVDAANTVYVIEVDADRLDVNGGFSHVRVRAASPGVNADLLAAHYVFGDLRYQGLLEDRVDPKA